MTAETQNTGDLTLRLLPPEECWRLWPARQETRTDEPEPKAEHSLQLAAEYRKSLIGSITAERGWVVSNFWVDRRVRGTGLAAKLAHDIAAMNEEGLSEFLITTNPHVERLVHSLGFVPLEGRLWRR